MNGPPEGGTPNGRGVRSSAFRQSAARQGRLALPDVDSPESTSPCNRAMLAVYWAFIVMARKPALAFVFVTLVLDILGIGLIIPITPRLIESFQGTGVADASKTYGLLVALYSLMQFAFAPILGSLS